jgi:hypothetical protein
MQFPPILTFSKNYNYCLRALDIWNIDHMKDDKMHPSIFLLSNVHMMLLLMAFLAKPMFSATTLTLGLQPRQGHGKVRVENAT